LVEHFLCHIKDFHKKAPLAISADYWIEKNNIFPQANSDIAL
jgi:hypothetical protein